MPFLRGDTAPSADFYGDAPDRSQLKALRRQDESSVMDESIIDVSTDSDTLGTPKLKGELARPPGEDPLWAIADVMLGKVEYLLSRSVKERSHPTPPTSTFQPIGANELFVKRVTEDEVRRLTARMHLQLIPKLVKVSYAVSHVRGSRHRKISIC